MNADLFKQEKKRGYIITVIAGLVGLIAFYLPYVTFTETSSNSSFSLNGAISGLIGAALFITTLVIIISAVLLFSNTAFGLTNISYEKQVQYGNYAILGGSALVFLFHLIFALGDHNFVIFNIPILGPGLTVGLGAGFWLFLVASLAMIAGGVLAISPSIVSSIFSRGAGAHRQPYQQPYQPPYSTGDQPYSQYQGQYPPQQGYPPQYPQQYPQQGYQEQYTPKEMSQQGYPPQQFDPDATQRAQFPQHPPPPPQQQQQQTQPPPNPPSQPG